MKPLANSILKTLAYFDLLNFPLTQEELFRFLWVPLRMGYEEFASLIGANGRSPLHHAIEFKDNFYFLSGRASLVEQRQQAARETEKKLIIAHRAVKFICAVPFLKAIFVCNSVGAGMARPESDIDLFIVTEKKRIWIVRFFTNLILRIFGLRTYGAHQANRICLSFYIDSAHLDLSPWRVADDDIHFAYWLNMMTPVYDPENYYEKFLRANQWVEKYVPNILTQATADHPAPLLRKEGAIGVPASRGATDRVIPPCEGGIGLVAGDGVVGRFWKHVWELMWRGSCGDIIENEAQKFQLMKLKLSIKEKSKLPDHGVVIADGVLKFHENDTRLSIRQKWLKKIQA